MAIDKLSSAAAIVAMLRAAKSQRGERSIRKATKGADTVSSQSVTVRNEKALRMQLAQIVKAVDIGDRESAQAVRHQVVRAILLWEIGPAFREHPEWQPVLESITRNLEGHVSHETQFARLISELQTE
jgi:hypothetical protein